MDLAVVDSQLLAADCNRVSLRGSTQPVDRLPRLPHLLAPRRDRLSDEVGDDKAAEPNLA
jgi:hypothetical protein